LSVDQGFIGSWAEWALKNQREQLAQDEPLNWVMQIATHNSYNTFGDGHAFIDLPNQVYSTTDQLRAGARAITFDNYYFLGAARLCHSAFDPFSKQPPNSLPNLLAVPVLCAIQGPNEFYRDPLNQPGCLLHPVTNFPLPGFHPECDVHPSLRYYSNGIKEIRNWLDDNPNEIVIIDFEEYVPQMHGPDGAILDPIRAYLGDMVFTPPPFPPASVTGSIKPTATGSITTGLTTGVLTVTAVGSGTLHVDERITGTGIPDGTFIESFATGTTGGTGTYNVNNANDVSLIEVPSETITTASFSPGVFPDRWPTRREMLAKGKRVIFLDSAYNNFIFAKFKQPSEFLFNQDETVAGSYGDDGGTWLAKNQRRFGDPPAPGGQNGCFNTKDFNGDFNKTLFTKATIVVEERELGELIGFTLGGRSKTLAQVEFGLMSDKDIVDATECNYSIITLDKYSRELVPPDGSNNGTLDYLLYTPDPVHHPFGVADFHRQALVVWSWKPDDRGQNGDCAMLEDSSSGRWISANCSDQERFACARPRSHSGKDPLQWQDPVGNDWRVTSAKGSWDAGPSACQAEFGSDFVFRVPVNGYQNQILKGLPLAANDNVWLDYRQLNGDDKWVVDDEPPVMTCAATPSVLWPPNNKMVPVNLNVTAVSAVFGPTPFTLKSVTTSEGSAATDISGFVIGQPDTAGSLRASRLGTDKAGRVYTFVYQSVDPLGLTGTCTTHVLVPHDQGKSHP